MLFPPPTQAVVVADEPYRAINVSASAEVKTCGNRLNVVEEVAWLPATPPPPTADSKDEVGAGEDADAAAVVIMLPPLDDDDTATCCRAEASAPW